MCISRPFDTPIIFSKRKITKSLIITASLLVIIYSPNAAYKRKWVGADKVKDSSLFDPDMRYSSIYDSDRKYTHSEGECVSLPTDYIMNMIMTVMVHVDFIVAALLPFVIMIVCNAVLIFKLLEKEENRKNMKSTGSGPDLTNLTTTLLVVSFTYILLTSPSAILVIGWEFFGITSGHSVVSVKLWRSFAKMFLVMNNALNFVQYVCTATRFRTASKNLLNHGMKNAVKMFSIRKKPSSHNSIEMQVMSRTFINTF